MTYIARKIPTEIRTVQWTGDNVEEVRELTGEDYFRSIEPVFELTAQVYDHLHDTWVDVKTGDWIIEGTEGEVYPCDKVVFSKIYELLDCE